jgi:predicted DNA-binding protein
MLGYSKEMKVISISIELKPEIEERLEQDSAAKGVSVESYIEELIEQQFSQPHKSHIALEESDQVIDALVEAQKAAQFSPQTHTRARASIIITTDSLPRG